MKDKKGITITNAFQKVLNESNRKPNKIWVDKGSEFYNRPMKSWLEKNSIEMYTMHNEEKSVVVERFIRILKNKIYKYMTSVSKNIYIDKLDDIVNKYNNTVSWTYVIDYHNGEKIVGTFCENELQKTNQKEFEIEKVMKRKGDKLYVKWKGYDNSFNSWIDKKDIV